VLASYTVKDILELMNRSVPPFQFAEEYGGSDDVMSCEAQDLPNLVQVPAGSVAHIVVRPARLEDAEAMGAIRADRQQDVVPVKDPVYTAERKQYWLEHGTERRSVAVRASLLEPDHYFARTALSGGKVIGYASAEAPPEAVYTYWRGLTIARGYDGRGAGRALEFERQAWARRIGRPVRVLVVMGNDRSMDFCQRQGFQLVDIQEPTPEEPLRFNVLELGLTALMNV
jgi:GNAT superfamily N-acetyltransferase